MRNAGEIYIWHVLAQVLTCAINLSFGEETDGGSRLLSGEVVRGVFHSTHSIVRSKVMKKAYAQFSGHPGTNAIMYLCLSMLPKV